MSKQARRGKQKSDFSIETQKRVAELYCAGNHLTQISKSLSLGYSNVRTLLKRAGVPLRSASETSKIPAYKTLRDCRHCLQEFQISNTAQVYCNSCCPTRKAYQRLKYYKLSQPEFDALLENQHGCCALCDNVLIDGGSTNLNVDHCHTTGKVRGLLCHRCNMIAGFLDKDDWVERLHKIEQYIRVTSNKTVI